MAFITVLAVTTAQAQRVALVIGNSTYQHADLLTNPSNDSRAVAEALKRLRFERVMLHENLGAEPMRRKLLEFEQYASAADIALVCYAGHGIEVDGINYLIPIDARLARANAVEVEAVSLGTVTSVVAGARKLRLVILDSCRNNPFRSRVGSDASGRKRSVGRACGPACGLAGVGGEPPRAARVTARRHRAAARAERPRRRR